MTPDSDQIQNTDLETLARARFTELTAAEIKLLQAAPKGEIAVCGPNDDDSDPANDPSKADEWGEDRHIRAGLIRWLCVDRQAKELVDPKGLQAYGAKIPEALDLSYVTVPFPLTLWHCRLMDHLNLRGGEMPKLDLQGTWVHSIGADSAKVKGNVFFRNSFRAEGQVRLAGAQIGGNLECDHATFKNPLQPGVAGTGAALSADGMTVTGAIFLRNGFHAEGAVRLLGAQIGGQLSCIGGTFKNPPQEGVEGTREALSADGIAVRGSVLLRDGFRAEGEVRLLNARIGGDLECAEVAISGELNAERAVIKGALYWRGIADPARAKLNLTNASVGALFDEIVSWPAPGNLSVDGFVYERISGGPRDARTRLEWLALQDPFEPQPYRQLAKVLREEGYNTGAQLVLFEMENRRRKEEDPTWFARLLTALFRWTVGYGYYPARPAVRWLAGFMVFGLLLFGGGYSAGSITPTDKDAYGPFKQNSQLPPHYESFNPLIYSLENSFPLVRLGQADRWQPDPDRHWECKPARWMPRPLCRVFLPTCLRTFRWAQVCAGWFFATMVVAGVTGIVRKD